MARSKLSDCLQKTKRLPREVKRAIKARARDLADERDLDPTVAAQAVVTELRDQARADAATVQAALKGEVRESLPPGVAGQIATAHNTHGGSTINSVHGDLRGSNSFSVSIFPDLTTPIPGKTVTPEQIEEFSTKAQAAGIDTNNPNISIGTWYNQKTGITVVDVAFTTTDRQRAIELGRQFNQEAIYDLDAGEEIPTGGTGEALAGLPSIEERLGILFPPSDIAPSYATGTAQAQAPPGAQGAPIAPGPQALARGAQEVQQDLGGPQAEEPRGLRGQSEAPGVTPQLLAAQVVAADLQARMPQGPKIVVVQTTDEIAQQYGEKTAGRILAGRPEAFYDPKSDTVVVIAENAAPMEGESLEAYFTRKVLHEAAGHGGFSRLFGGGPLEGQYLSTFGAAFDFLARQDFGPEWETKHGYRSLAELAQRYGYDITDPQGRARTAEEHLSRLAEDPAPPRWFDAFLTQVTGLMRALGFNTWTNADTRSLLLRARDQVGLDHRTELENQSELRFSAHMEDISGNPEKERGFVTSVKEAAEIAPEVKERVHGVYRVLTNAETQAAAAAWLKSVGTEEAIKALRNKINPTAQDYAAGIQLLGELQEAGRFDDASEVAMAMAEHATTQGQAIQSLSLLTAMTPAGAQVHAARVIEKDIKKNPEMEKMAGEISRLRGELRSARKKLAARAIARKAKGGDLAARINKQLVYNPGSIWGRYKEGAVKQLASKLLGPKPARPIPALEAFTRRLARNLREQLPKGGLRGAHPTPAPVDEAAMLGEAVRNMSKYREVWKEAQAHIQEMFKDHPEALQSLDDYLGQILERPFSEASMERAVRQVTAELQTSMEEILVQSAGEKARRKSQIKHEIMTRSGLSGAEAEDFADSISEEFERELQAERDKTLKRLQRAGGARLKKSEIARLIERNNAGQLDDTRFFEHLAKAYKIPTWTQALSEKVQRLQREYEAALKADNADVALVRAAEIFDAIHSIVPEDGWARVASIQNIAMLVNPKTIIRNILGNAFLFAVDVPIDAAHAYMVDPVLGWFTGRRVRRSVEVAARWQGLVTPAKDWWNGYRFAREAGASKAKSIKEGVATMLTLGKLTSRGQYRVGTLEGRPRLHTFTGAGFSSRFGRLMEDGLALVLSPADRAFHQAAFHASIARQQTLARAEGREDIVTAEMTEQALLDAAKAVYQDENRVSRGLLKIRRGLNEATTGSEKWGLGSLIVPFAQVPASILIRGMDYSPIGFIRSAYELGRPMFGREFRQKELGEAVVRAASGTGALFVTGMWLYSIGVISGMAEEDDDLEAMRQASGMGRYRINVSALWRAMQSGNWWSKQAGQEGDLTMNYDWAQPLAMPLAMGVDYARAQDESKREATPLGQPEPWYVSLASGLQSAAGSFTEGASGSLAAQPLMQGLYRLAVRAAANKDILSATLGAVADAPSVFIPTLINQVNQYMGNNLVPELQAGGMFEKSVNRALARVPGVSQKFPPKYDVFGEAVERFQYGGNSFFNVFFNPATIRELKTNPAIREMEAVYAATGEAAILPNRVAPTLAWKGAKVPLTNEQISRYQQISGKLAMGAFTALAASPEFARAPAGAKAKIMGSVLGEVSEASKTLLFLGDEGVQKGVATGVMQNVQRQVRLLQTPAPAGP